MPTIHCASKIDCLPCDDFPIQNISAESADLDRYISRFSFLNAIPPIRQYPDFDEQGVGIFLQVGCKRWCWSTVSQEDADDCARRQAIECAFGPLMPDIPIPDEFHPNRISLFSNAAVTGTAACPDGNLFSYTMAAGRVVALTQGQANAIAFSLAQQRARAHRVCISDMNDPICVNTWVTKQITASGQYVAVFPATDRWELVSGSVPDGMTLETGFTSDGITLQGIPTTLGDYQFRVRVTISTLGSAGYGDFMEKVFTVKIVGITEDSPLPDAILDTAYSQQLHATGSTDTTGEIWSITSGTLPDGLSLSPQGLIEGTPTGSLAGYSFTVQVQFTVGMQTAVCSKQMSITTSEGVDLGVIVPSITVSLPPTFWDSGNPQPPGRYRIRYEGGAMQYANCMPDPCWSVNTVGAGFRCLFFAGGGFPGILFPATENVFLTQAEAEADNSGKFIDFDTTVAAAISMRLGDTNYADNQPGAPNPTFRLFRLALA